MPVAEDVTVAKPGSAVLINAGSANSAPPQGDLPWNSQGVFFADYLAAEPYQIQVGGGTYPLQLIAGGHLAVAVKPGPWIGLVAPAAGNVPTLSPAPGMSIAIYGSHLEGASVTIDGISAPVLFNSGGQINTVVPDGSKGLVPVTVMNAMGRDSLNILLEAAVPAVFTVDGSGTGAALALHTGDSSTVSPSNPARAGETISIFLTGLGVPAQMPVIQADGVPVNVIGIGPLAGSPGVIRLDLAMPEPAAGARSIQLQAVGAFVSNVVTLAAAP